jgi:hypothetical protein
MKLTMALILLVRETDVLGIYIYIYIIYIYISYIFCELN